MPQLLGDKLRHAATAYDKRCCARERMPNIYRLGHIFSRIAECEADIAAGADVRATLCDGFNDRLLDVMLKAAGCERATLDEVRGIRR